jgi:hypothetical protein
MCAWSLLPLDDCLSAPQAAIPHLTRSPLHQKPRQQKFRSYRLGYLPIDIAEVRTVAGKAPPVQSRGFGQDRRAGSQSVRNAGARRGPTGG